MFSRIISSRSVVFRGANPSRRLILGISPQPLHARFYARKSARRTTVDVEEQTQQQTGQVQGWQQEQNNTFQAYGRREEPGQEEPEETTENTLTPDVRAHLSKVYGTMMGGMAFAAIGAFLGASAPALAFPASLAALGGIIGLYFVDPAKTTTRQNIFLGISGLLGMGIAPLVAASAPGVVFAAALGTSGIFAGFTIAALKAKRKAMLMLGGPLIGGLFFIVGCSLAGILLPMMGVTSPAVLGALYNINLYGGLALFSLFIAYDTQKMIEDFKDGQTDHVAPALGMFLNLLNIFIRLLTIFGGRSD